MPAFLLSPWQALDFFANSPENSLVHLTYTDESAHFRKMAKPLYEAIQNEDFMPDFTQSMKDGLSWKLMGGQELDEQSQQWLAAALEDFFQSDKALAEAWNEIISSFPLIKSTGQERTIVDEHDWLEKIGWVKDNTPFHVVLRLDEPEIDEGNWKIETVLRNKENEDEIFIYSG